MNSLKQVNTAFRAYCKEFGIELKRGRPQNDQCTYARVAYCDFIESLRCSNIITEKLAKNANYK